MMSLRGKLRESRSRYHAHPEQWDAADVACVVAEWLREQADDVNDGNGVSGYLRMLARRAEGEG